MHSYILFGGIWCSLLTLDRVMPCEKRKHELENLLNLYFTAENSLFTFPQIGENREIHPI